MVSSIAAGRSSAAARASILKTSLAEDDLTRPPQDVRVSARTGARVAGMSEEERAEIARKLAGRGKRVDEAAPRQAARALAGPPPAVNEDASAAVLRLTAELNRTERRLDRMERAATGGRYQIGGDGAPSGRYARLLSRADRLERQLRSLRS